MLNIALIGLGRIGRKYFKILKKNEHFNLIKVLRKKNYTRKNTFVKFYNNRNKFFSKNKKNIHAYIIASPLNTHYEYIKKILTKKKPLIIEKPIVKNIHELKKINILSNNVKHPVLVNHTDLYNPAFKKLEKKLKLIGNYRKIKIEFGKFKKIYKINNKSSTVLPYFDWLPHPLAITVKLVGFPNKITILKEKIIINGQEYDSLHFNFSSTDKKLKKDKKLNTDVWYDEKTLNWVKASFNKKGKWEYKLVSVE